MKPLRLAGVSECMNTTVDSHQANCVYAGDVYIKRAKYMYTQGFGFVSTPVYVS